MNGKQIGYDPNCKYCQEHKRRRDALNKKKNTKRIQFHGKDVWLPFDPKAGVCNVCRAVKGIDCPTTEMHHVEYHLDAPLKDTIELCPRCHRRYPQDTAHHQTEELELRTLYAARYRARYRGDEYNARRRESYRLFVH
jgi:hypothetical protein